MSNCIKSRYEKCPLKDNCFDLVDDSEDCKCRLEDYQKGRADTIDECIRALIDHCDAMQNGMYVNALKHLKEKKNG